MDGCLLRRVEAEVADEEVGLGGGEVLLVLGIGFGHVVFGEFEITPKSVTGYAVTDAEIFLGDELLCHGVSRL